MQEAFGLAFGSTNKAKAADIGCGAGRLLRWLSPSADVVVGVEPSADRFKEAAKVAQGLPNVVVVNGDSGVLPDEAFDVVLCSHIFQHLSFAEQEKLAAHIKRILKDDGVVVVTTTFTTGPQSRYTKEYWRDGERVCEDTDAEGFDSAYGMQDVLPVRLFSHDELLGYFEGFQVLWEGCYHFSEARTADEDADLNAAGELDSARDAFYVLRKSSHE